MATRCGGTGAGRHHTRATRVITFVPHPQIAVRKSLFDPAIHLTWYRYDYEKIFADIARQPAATKESFAKSILRKLVLNDLFFILLFIQGIEKANHPFVVGQCHMVQDGPQSDTLDVWARFHWKSAIITVAETLQYHLKYPEECTGILAYARPAAKKFLRSIKNLCEQSVTLKKGFPDVLWENPTVESPKWSEDDGLVFKRKSASRGESTIEAYGLTEGQPTGRHFERLVVDDAETEDIAKSPKMLTDVFSKFEMAIFNLGTGSDKDKRRVIGTYYNHVGPIKRIGDMKFDDTKDEQGNVIPGKPMWKLRVIPATHDGTITGTPVLLDPETWQRIKVTRHVNSQQLCNPTPEGDVILDYVMFQPIEPEFLPKGRFKFFVVDQAGGDDTNISKGQGDMWSIGVVSILPATNNLELDEDDLGISDVYLEDLIADQMTHSEAIETIIRMYMRNGMIMQFGVEKVGLSTTEIHVAEALKKKGRKLSVENGNLVLLRPANRSLEQRVKSALQWPLNNSKLWYSTAISPVYRDKMIEEMKNFPVYHTDILNMLAYAYDLFAAFKFERHRPRVVQSVSQIMAAGPIRNEWGR